MKSRGNKMSIILETKKLKKIYNYRLDNEYEALHEINFQVEKGEFICVMGPSGSGKSTFINNISTIDMPTEGLVYINGVEIHTMTANQIGKFRYENIGFVFQEFNLLDSHTLYENIAMPLALAKVDKKEIDQRIHEIAKRMDIESLLNKYPNECSGGQRQRCAICRALVTNPKMIIADEPTGNLDSHNSNELLQIFKQLNEEEGVTIIMVTHDSLIASYSSKLIYIKDGYIEETIERKNLSQNEYFEKIMSINAKESRGMIND
jgi:putative ABC transport system ATP-binding protein